MSLFQFSVKKTQTTNLLKYIENVFHPNNYHLLNCSLLVLPEITVLSQTIFIFTFFLSSIEYRVQ